MGVQEEKNKEKWTSLYLTLDVDAGESLSSGAFEQLACFSGQEHNCAFLFLKQLLAVMVEDELGCLHVGLEIEFFGDKTQWDIRLIATCGW